MLFNVISKTLGVYLLYLAGILCVPATLAAYYEFLVDPSTHPQPHSTVAFLLTMGICLTLSGLLCFLGRRSLDQIYRREGLAVVALIWFLTSIIGGLPFFLSGTLEDPVDAYFEAMSGLTTTGATCMQAKKYSPVTGEEIPIRDVSTVPPYQIYSFYGTITPVVNPETKEVVAEGVEAVGSALLFWRSLMQWLGGMGVVVLLVAILPALGVGGRVLFQAEVPGPVESAVTPRIKETASLLWKLYLGFSIFEVFLLLRTNGDMTFFDAICITFSNISTGGFTVHNSSIAYYNSWATELVIIIFMIFGSINFNLYFFIIKKKFYKIFEPEFLVYMGVLLVFGLWISLELLGTEKVLLNGEMGLFNLPSSLRYGFFTFVSAITSTGFCTADYNMWPYICQVIILSAMFIGSMSGSTGGGIKIIRHCVLFQVGKKAVDSVFRPEEVKKMRLGPTEIDDTTANKVLVFFFFVILFSAMATFVFVVAGIDMETALSVTACMINNTGIAFRQAGPTESFAFLDPVAKLVSCFLMVLGRLEFFALLLLLVPRFWTNK